MKTVARICLLIVFVGCLALAGFLLHGKLEKETWPTLAGLLAVIASVIAVLPALRILEIQEDSFRPRPTPYFDLTSRADLLQLRVRNLGAGVAYDVRLRWKVHPINYEGAEILSLDRISVLLPQESVSTLVGASSTSVKALADERFEGECWCKDSTGKTYRSTFVCSVDASQKQLLHDSELPRTLRDLQDIPKELARIAVLLETLKQDSERQ